MTCTWKTRWTTLRPLGEGGQGRVFVVRRRDGSDPTEHVLKVLKQSTKAERRSRMAREVAALRQLNSPGVPKVVEDNCDTAADTDELFVVMEHVPGPTLEEHVQAGPCTLDEAMLITGAVVDVVEYVLANGLVHRDIKPDNIVLRAGDPAKPTLLDFGLTVDFEEKGNLTETEQQVGNRFLSLPEQSTPGDNKRDVRSDLTLCSALLFYAFTGRQPMRLEDGEGRKPHKRRDVQARLATLETERLVPLTQLFDVAFRPRVSERVQNIEELRRLLGAVSSGNAPPAVEPAPTVESLWTLHMIGGQPDALYFHHRVSARLDSAAFFLDGNKAPILLRNLSSDLAQAAAVVWEDIVGRPEVRAHLSVGREFQRAFDHLNHILDENWAASGAPATHLRWNRELEVPGARTGGPSADIPIALLGAGAQAAVRVLDGAARRGGASALEEALAKKAAW